MFQDASSNHMLQAIPESSDSLSHASPALALGNFMFQAAPADASEAENQVFCSSLL